MVPKLDRLERMQLGMDDRLSNSLLLRSLSMPGIIHAFAQLSAMHLPSLMSVTVLNKLANRTNHLQQGDTYLRQITTFRLILMFMLMLLPSASNPLNNNIKRISLERKILQRL